MDNIFRAARIPQIGMVLDHVEAQCQYNICIVDGEAYTVLGPQADRVQAIVRVHIHTAFGHEGADHTDSGLLTKPAELLAGAFSDATVTGEDDGSFRVPDDIESLVDDLVIRHGAPEPDRFERHGVRLHFGHVFGQFNVHGPGLFGSGKPHGLANNLGNRIGMQDTCCPFCHRPEHFHHVHDLVRLLVQSLRRALAREHQHGCPVHVRVGHTGNEIRGPGSKCAQASRGITGQTTVNLCHECGALLVPGQYEFYFAGLVE